MAAQEGGAPAALPGGPRPAPAVTVAIPTWNRATLVAQSIRSVLDQSLGDLEVWVIDDASTDGTDAAVAAIGDPRVHLLRNETRLGLNANLSRCLTVGNAPLVVVFGDDDLMLPGNLERKAGFLDARPEVGFVHSAIRWIDEAGATIAPYVAPHGMVVWDDHWQGAEPDSVLAGPAFVRQFMAGGCLVDLSAAVIRRSLIGGRTFREIDGPACDMSFWMAVGMGTRVAYLAEPLTARRVHASELVRSGMMELSGSGYRLTWSHIALQRDVKLRFLASPDAASFDAADAQRLTRLAVRWAREQALY
ncbi:MAG: glycosyltransferase family 2 protein, partial [Actinomycetota bacterium]